MSDRWEFANDKFRRGKQGLLSEIQRRRRPSLPSASPAIGSSAPLLPLPPPTTTLTTTTDSTDTPNSSSTRPQSPAGPKLTDLTNENAKLRQEKQTLTMEIARTKKMCEDLLANLSKYVNTKGLDVQLLMKEGAVEALEEMLNLKTAHDAATEVAVEEVGESVKLFGALLKVSVQSRCMKDRKRRAGWSEKGGNACSSGERPMKIAPWIPTGSSSFQPGSSQVSN